MLARQLYLAIRMAIFIKRMKKWGKKNKNIFDYLCLNICCCPSQLSPIYRATPLWPQRYLRHHLALPIEAWESAGQCHLLGIIYLMDAGNTNERFNDSQAVRVKWRRERIYVFDISAKLCAICRYEMKNLETYTGQQKRAAKLLLYMYIFMWKIQYIYRNIYVYI